MPAKFVGPLSPGWGLTSNPTRTAAAHPFWQSIQEKAFRGESLAGLQRQWDKGKTGAAAHHCVQVHAET